MNDSLSRIRIVLSRTSHPGNIGAAARAMKTMGFDDMVLVAPRWANVLRREETIQRASGANDVLAKTRVLDTLDEALESEGESGVSEEYASDEVLPGAEAVVTAELTPGNWILLCPIPTPDGAPHFAEGMIWEFAIT